MTDKDWEYVEQMLNSMYKEVDETVRHTIKAIAKKCSEENKNGRKPN